MSTKTHPKNELAATFVAKTRQPGRYADGNGLYLVIEPSGARRWEQRIMIRGKRRTLGLGGFSVVSLAHRLLSQLGIPSVPYGFRMSFRVWVQEQTNVPREVCEAALAHTNPNKAEVAYARSGLFERRRELMDWWARYLNPEPAAVVFLDARRGAMR